MATYKARPFHTLDNVRGFIASLLTQVSNTEQL